MEKWVSDGAWTRHRIPKGVSGRRIVTGKEKGIGNSGEDPRRSLPFVPWFA